MSSNFHMLNQSKLILISHRSSGLLHNGIQDLKVLPVKPIYPIIIPVIILLVGSVVFGSVQTLNLLLIP
jgi:hypothetical protein